MSESDPSLGSCNDNEEVDVSETEMVLFTKTSSIPAPYSFEPIVIQNQTVPQRIIVLTLTTVDFQICHGKMSKNSGSSQVSQVFFVCLCTFLLFCVAGRVQGISHTFSIMY